MQNNNVRIKYPKIEGTAQLFTDEFINYLLALHDHFSDRIKAIRTVRQQTLTEAHSKGIASLSLPLSEINTGKWVVDTVPTELKSPGIEISGPAGIANMFINALNPGPEGERAVGYLDDDEDSGGHSFKDTINSAINRLEASEGTLSYEDPKRERVYKLEPGNLPFFMHRERGLHLDEHEVTIDGQSISATLLSTALTLFHVGRSQMRQGRGVYFYLPKLESVSEVEIYKDLFDLSKEILHLDSNSTIKAIILVESLPAVFRMENMLHALGQYGAGLNAARWDLKASILEYILPDPKSVWPDRFEVDIKTTKFMSDIFRRLVAICLKREAVAIGGMATALPSRDEEVNQIAADSIKSDKEWEARQGFLRGWSAHIYHMKTASDPFKEWWGTGWQPTIEMSNPDNYPVHIETPEGKITSEGTIRNIRTIIEYVEGWLNGRGAKGIDSMEDQDGKRPSLMEDLATARISVGQVAQRILHHVSCQTTGVIHTPQVIKEMVDNATTNILEIRKSQLKESDFIDAKNRYQIARKVCLKWIQNYTELNFRSLGSYTQEELKRIGLEADALQKK